MRYSFTDLPHLQNEGFDSIIDVRSPSEFAEDHVPGAVNMPVLSDAERAEVGTIYTQESPFKARKIGAALVARNAAAAIETYLMARDGSWRPLVYCWRGGQRSGSFASILGQIGWRVSVLDGGYQSWRRHVVDTLYRRPLTFRVVRLDGFTGTGKTEILGEVARLGGQVLDLEGLACHRGSVLGDTGHPQPMQKGFETALVAALAKLDPARPVLVEAESARIGALRLPPSLWTAMKGSPRILVDAPVAARAAYLERGYIALQQTPAQLMDRFEALVLWVGRAKVLKWQELVASRDYRALAEDLITVHYDPAYRRARRRDDGTVTSEVQLAELTKAEIDAAAQVIRAQLG